jgi:hypothetical protein
MRDTRVGAKRFRQGGLVRSRGHKIVCDFWTLCEELAKDLDGRALYASSGRINERPGINEDVRVIGHTV